MKLQPTLHQFFVELKAYVEANHFDAIAHMRLEYEMGSNSGVHLHIVEMSDLGIRYSWKLDDGDDFADLDKLKTEISEHIQATQKQALDKYTKSLGDK